MTEYYVVYDAATGAIRWNGQGPPGTAGTQLLEEGTAALALPYEAWIALPDLTRLKAVSQRLVDAAAGAFRSNFITTVPGQAETYIYKAAEARAWLSDHASLTYFLAPEAEARGMTMQALADEVLVNEAGWKPIGGRIEAARLAAKKAIGDAATIPEIVAASNIDWSATITAPPT